MSCFELFFSCMMYSNIRNISDLFLIRPDTHASAILMTLYDKSRIVALKLGFLQRKSKTRICLRFKLSFILNDEMILLTCKKVACDLFIIQESISAILSTYIKLPCAIIFVWSTFEWPLKTGFTVLPNGKFRFLFLKQNYFKFNDLQWRGGGGGWMGCNVALKHK